MKLPMLSADAKLAEIRRLYYNASRQTIEADLAKALDLLKSMASEEERERARGLIVPQQPELARYRCFLRKRRKDRRTNAALRACAFTVALNFYVTSRNLYSRINRLYRVQHASRDRSLRQRSL